MGPPSASVPKSLGRLLALAPVDAATLIHAGTRDMGQDTSWAWWREHRTCHILLLLTKPQVIHQTPSLTAPGQPGKKGVVYAEHWSGRFTSREAELTQQWEAGPTAASKTPMSLACCKEQWICGGGGFKQLEESPFSPLWSSEHDKTALLKPLEKSN